MALHVLPGDSLLGPFEAAGIPGDVAVFRECLIDGPCAAASLEELFVLREKYLDGHSAGFYSSHVRPEVEKILNYQADLPIYLWFEHELFCQVNLWFLLYYVAQDADLFVVVPEVADERERFRGWRDHGPEDLKERFANCEPIESADRELGAQLWMAYSRRDSPALLESGDRSSKIFKYLNEVTEAAAQVESRPESMLRTFAEEGMEFEEAFRAFCEKEPVYGIGDLQAKRIWDSVSVR